MEDHRALPRGTVTTPPLSLPAAVGMDETANIAKSPQAARWECPELVAEEATILLRVRLARVVHLPTAVGKAPRAGPAEIRTLMGRHGH